MTDKCVDEKHKEGWTVCKECKEDICFICNQSDVDLYGIHDVCGDCHGVICESCINDSDDEEDEEEMHLRCTECGLVQCRECREGRKISKNSRYCFECISSGVK